ncbi:MAG TPA: hypothetical protein VH392_01230, partial [Sphingomicrobium sp.]
MTGRIITTGIALGLGLVAAAAIAAPTPKKAPAPDAAARKLVQNCDAHKFETVVHDEVDGKPHQSKVKLCGVEG